MTPPQKPTEQEWSKADKDWGYRFGCDGTMSIAQAAEHIGLAERTGYNLVYAGNIRSGHPVSGKQTMKKTLVCRRSVDDYLAKIED